MDDNNSIDKLIHRYLDDSLSEADEAKLLASLENQPQVRRQFVQEALLDGDLRDVMREADICQFIGSDEAEITPTTPASRSLLGQLFRGGVAAAALVAIVIVLAQTARQQVAPPLRPVAQLTSSDAHAVAPPVGTACVGTIVQQKDCRWKEAPAAWNNGDVIPPNTTLSLESGIAEVVLENGVRLLLAGPCQIQLIDEMQGKLSRGSLTAVVPTAAHGYTLLTPSSQVIDLGTEFGIDVDPSGESEVHVFKGEVISRWHGGDGKGHNRSLRLREKNAARFGTRESETALITADESRFVRDLAPRLSFEELPPLPIRQDLALWLAADRMIETDSEGRVKSWSDLLCDPSQTFQVAFQLDAKARPTLVPSGINGRPAVRFDGDDDYLVTTPLETTDCQTLFAVFTLSDSGPTLGPVINYNGPPHRQLRFPAMPGILQITARRFDDGALRVRGFMNTGWAPNGWTFDGDVSARFPAGVDDRQAIIVSYRYDPTANDAKMFVNGKVVSQESAPCPAAITSRKVIGRRGYGEKDYRFLRGDIGELLIYNRSLTDEQVGQVHNYLATRYDNSSEIAGDSAP